LRERGFDNGLLKAYLEGYVSRCFPKDCKREPQTIVEVSQVRVSVSSYFNVQQPPSDRQRSLYGLIFCDWVCISSLIRLDYCTRFVSKTAATRESTAVTENFQEFFMCQVLH